MTTEPGPNDVLVGRHIRLLFPEGHPGTVRVKEYIRQHALAYSSADQSRDYRDPPEKMSKSCYITAVVDQVRREAGRFLIQQEKHGPFVQLSPTRARSNLSKWFNDEARKQKKNPKANKTRPTPEQTAAQAPKQPVATVPKEPDPPRKPSPKPKKPRKQKPPKSKPNPLIHKYDPVEPYDDAILEASLEVPGMGGCLDDWEDYPGDPSEWVPTDADSFGATAKKAPCLPSFPPPQHEEPSGASSSSLPQDLSQDDNDELLQALHVIKPHHIGESQVEQVTKPHAKPSLAPPYLRTPSIKSINSAMETISEQDTLSLSMREAISDIDSLMKDDSSSVAARFGLKYPPQLAPPEKQNPDAAQSEASVGECQSMDETTISNLTLGTNSTGDFPESMSNGSRPPLEKLLSATDMSSAAFSRFMAEVDDAGNGMSVLSMDTPQPRPALDASTRSARSRSARSKGTPGQFDDVFSATFHSDISDITSMTRSRSGAVPAKHITGGGDWAMLTRDSSRKLKITGDDEDMSVMTVDVDVRKLLYRMTSQQKDAALQTLCFGELAGVAWGDKSDDLADVVIASMTNLVSIMRQHWQNPQVQGQGCLAFGWLAESNPRIGLSIANLEGIETILDAMRQHHRDESTQANGCMALGSLASYNLLHQRKIAALGGIQTILEAMSEFLNSTGVQKDACTALTRLARGNEDNMVAMAEADGVVAISRAMQVNCENEDIQVNGCGALALLGSKFRVRELVVRGGGVQAVLNGMGFHTANQKVQANGCLALRQVAFDPYLDSIVDANGLDLILKSMRNFEDDEVIQLHGCFVLGRISEMNPQNRESITKFGGIATMCRTTQIEWNDLNVNNEARHTLQLVAMNNNSAQKQIAKSIVGAMRKSLTDPVAQANGCSTLSAIAKHNRESCQWILAAGGIDAVVVAMLNHPYNEQVLGSGTVALETLGNDVSDNQSADAIDCILAIYSAMCYNEGKGGAQEKSCRLLAQLLFTNAQNSKVTEKFSEAGGVVTLVAAMKRFPANLQIQGNGCASLYMLCRENPSIRSAVVSAGGAKAVVSAIQNWLSQESVVNYGCKILEALASGNKSRREEISKAGTHAALYDAIAAFPRNHDLVRAAKRALSLLGGVTELKLHKPVEPANRLSCVPEIRAC